MYLVMIVDGTEIARKNYLPADKLSEMIAKMKKEYSSKIGEGKEPQFYLVNIPSAINSFKSLIPARDQYENR